MEIGCDFVSIVLTTEQREQAGSDSYNRFEYQTHWIVCHIIDQLDTNPKCIVFCEYHDDMAQLTDGEGSLFEFYQIKTKEKSDGWSIVELCADTIYSAVFDMDCAYF